LPLAKELESRGHRVNLNIPQAFERFAKQLGIPYTVQGHDDITGMLEKSPDTRDILEWTKRVIQHQFNELIPLLQDYDMLVASNTEFAAPSIAVYCNKTYIRTAYAPLMPSRKIPPPVIPFPEPNPLFRPMFFWNMLALGINYMSLKPLNAHRKRLGLKPIKDQSAHAPAHADNLNLYSPTLGEIDEDWPYPWSQAAYCFNDLLPYEEAVCARLIEFITQNDQPVLFFTMGSITAEVRERFCLWLYEICIKHNWKFIIGSGWSGLGKTISHDKNVFLLDKVIPHNQFLPLCTAAIHHGGSGTTHSASRAGIPQMVVPMVIDQFYWGYRTRVLGIGPGYVNIKRVKKDTLESKLFALMENPTYKKNAAALGEKIQKENGVQLAADYIERKITQG
jgi:UDP:flavonoid glycosyltransferase YjiC (YdhE family)